MTPEDLHALVVSSLTGIAPESDPASLGPGDDLREALDIDSMDFLRFVTALHAALGIDIPEADYPKLFTLEGAAAYLASRTG